MSIVKLIQQKVPLGSNLTVTLKTGDKKIGILKELSTTHLLLNSDHTDSTILLDMIAGFDVPNMPDTSINTVTDSDASTETMQDVKRYLANIEMIHSTIYTLEYMPPNLFMTLQQGNYPEHILRIWVKAKNKFENALKIQETSPIYGRINQIIAGLETLLTYAPEDAHFLRCTAYAYYLSQKLTKTYDCLKKASIISNLKFDWFNFSVISLKLGKKESACVGLIKFFSQSVPSDNLSAFRELTKLAVENSYFTALTTLCKIYANKQITKEDKRYLLDALLYCLIKTEQSHIATQIITKLLEENITAEKLNSLIIENIDYLKDNPPSLLIALLNEIESYKKSIETQNQFVVSNVFDGYIQDFKYERGFGFIIDSQNNKYYFNQSAVIDDELTAKLANFKSTHTTIPVQFETSKKSSGRYPDATKITFKYKPNDLFIKATKQASDGQYSKAIMFLKRLLSVSPNFPKANDLLKQYKENSLVSSLPKGNTAYPKAKRAQLIEKDFEKAIKLYKEAIKKKDNMESALKDLCMLYLQMNKNQEALDLLLNNKDKFRAIDDFHNLLISVYQKLNMYDELIKILKQRLASIGTRENVEQIYIQIANAYYKLSNYGDAISFYIKVNPENLTAQRNIALCLLKRGDKQSAIDKLNHLIHNYSDQKSADILEVINNSDIKINVLSIEEIVLETALHDYTTELSPFAKFLLDRCNFENINQSKIKDGVYIASEREMKRDIDALIDLATEHGTRRPHGRSQCYMEAAKIMFDREKNERDKDSAFRYLTRSLASMGDAALSDNKHLSTVRSFYLEAIKTYDNCKDRDNYYEQDAVNALARLVTSFLGRNEIPKEPPKRISEQPNEIQKEQSDYLISIIQDTIKKHTNKDTFFNAITHIIQKSRFAYEGFMKALISEPTTFEYYSNYLVTKGLLTKKTHIQADELQEITDQLLRDSLDLNRVVAEELKLLKDFKLMTSWLSESINKLNNLLSKEFINDLDTERIRDIQSILRLCLEFCSQTSFEEKERLCLLIKNRCDEFINNLQNNPTHLSIEQFEEIVQTIDKTIDTKLNELYETSKPKLSLYLPIETYFPDASRNIEVQISITNRLGSSPAESLELAIQPDDEYFMIDAKINTQESLSGDKEKTFIVPTKVTHKAIEEKTFKMSVYAQYKTRSDELLQTEVYDFSIRLYPEDEFEEIDNPYAIYTESGIVADPQMFYGRDELINNIVKILQNPKNHGKSIIVYGQKRAGKSSVLYHLKNRLQEQRTFIVLDIGNIGSILDEHSQTPLLYQILWTILSKLKDAIEDMTESYNFPTLSISLPNNIEFYEHPAPLQYFKDIFKGFTRACSKNQSWQGIKIIVLIDEFSYLYGHILTGKLPETFMQNWKALLQENYFSCVLAGQDIMPKFKQKFPNEFGITQDKKVTYLNQDDASKLIDEPIRIGDRNGESRYRGKAIKRIIELTAGSPFYIQMFCNRLVEYMNRKRATLITEADIEQVKNEMIRGSHAITLDKFDNLYDSGDTSKDAISKNDTLEVLKTIAKKTDGEPCHIDNINCEVSSPLVKILDELVNRDVLLKERQSYYQIKVGLFREWLKQNG